MLYWNPTVIQEYEDANNGANNQVRLSDICFAIHGLAITLVIVSQIYIYERGTQTVSYFCKCMCAIFIFAIAYYLLLCINLDDDGFSALDFVNFLSYIKLCITCIKYIPQAHMNFVRKSTVGCSIDNYILDFIGESVSQSVSHSFLLL